MRADATVKKRREGSGYVALTGVTVQRSVRRAAVALGLILLCAAWTRAEDVPLWGQFEMCVRNTKAYANPFTDVALDATMTRSDGSTVAISGFFDGDGAGGQTGHVWKFRCMPDRVGRWRYAYEWSDGTPGGSGEFSVVAAGRPGPIRVAGRGKHLWQITGCGDFIPFYVAGPPFWEVDDPRMDGFLDYAGDALGANGVALILTNRLWHDCADRVDCSPEHPAFSIRNWTRLDDLLKKLQERRMGANLMFYTDDAGRPLFAGRSALERLLLRHAMARLAAYPLITFDSGIDISEYRTAEWNDWFAQQLHACDPVGHLVSSRHGGGSGTFSCDACDYDSRGDVHPDATTILATMAAAPKPVFYTDRWREDFYRGGFDSHSLRIIMWHCALAGGAGFMIGGRHGELRLDDYASDLDDPAQFRAFSQFWHERVRSLRPLEVSRAASRGLCLAQKGRQYVVYLETGGSTTVDLTALTDPLGVEWLNPRTGRYTPESPVTQARSTTFTAPGEGDWVLHIGGFALDETPPTAPAILSAEAASESQVELTWAQARDADTGISAYRIYRNDISIARVPADRTTYRDPHCRERTAYRYEVAAVNGTGVEGPRSRLVTAATPRDTTPPRIVSATALAAQRRVHVVFSEPVDKNLVQVADNYAIVPDIAVRKAQLQPDGVTVTLTTSSFVPDVEYTLAVRNVQDRAVARNTIAADSQVALTVVRRVVDGLVALYDFTEGQGAVIHDVSGAGEPLDLRMEDEASIRWLGNGLAIERETLIRSSEAAKKIVDACRRSGAITIEAWIRPANTSQDGPARIVTLSTDASARDFTLGQAGTEYDVRLRTTATTGNGVPSLGTSGRAVRTDVTHVVYTRDASGRRALFLDGTERVAGEIGGELTNWDPTYRLGLANELSGGRGWLGEFYLVALYSRSLSDEEVGCNFEAGSLAESPASSGAR